MNEPLSKLDPASWGFARLVSFWVLMLGGGLLCGHWLMVQAATETLAMQRLERVGLHEQWLVLTSKRNAGKRYQFELGELASRMEAALPNITADQQGLLTALAQLGEERGVRGLNLQAGQEHWREWHWQQSLEMEMEGKYDELFQFIGALAGFERLFSLDDLSLEPVGDQPGWLALHARAEIYWRSAGGMATGLDGSAAGTIGQLPAGSPKSRTDSALDDHCGLADDGHGI